MVATAIGMETPSNRRNSVRIVHRIFSPLEFGVGDADSGSSNKGLRSSVGSGMLKVNWFRQPTACDFVLTYVANGS